MDRRLASEGSRNRHQRPGQEGWNSRARKLALVENGVAGKGFLLEGYDHGVGSVLVKDYLE